MRRLALAMLLAASVTAAGEEPLPRLSVADLRAEEGTFPGGSTIQEIRVSITPALAEEGEFQLRLVPGTADAEDIAWPWPEVHTVRIPAGKTEFAIQLFIPADGVPEADESLEMVVEAGRTPLVIERERITVTLLNDDNRAAITPERQTVAVGETLPMRLVLPEPVSVATTYAITAEAGLRAPEWVTIEAGESSAAFDVEALSTARQASVNVREGNSDVASEWIEVIDFTLFLAEPELRLRPGQSGTISVTAMPRRSLGVPLEALSSDPTVFTVRRKASSDGTIFITAVAPGTATLTLQSRGGAISTTARVVVTGK